MEQKAEGARARLKAPWLAALVVASAAPLAWTAWCEHGVFWPDEVLQTLEQGHRFAFGDGLVPWEFRDGVRSWLVPGAIGVVMKAAAALGVSTGLGLARVVKIAVALGTVASAFATIRTAERLAGVRAAMLAGILFAACPLVVFFGSRVFTDTISMPFVAFGALAMTRDCTRERSRLIIGHSSRASCARVTILLRA